LAAVALGGVAIAQTKQEPAARWEPARHEKDNWLDELPGQHRMLFDTTSSKALGDALLFSANYLNVNRSEYGLQNADLAVIIVLRHQSTAFAYNDAMWAKYGAPMAARSGLDQAQPAPTTNTRNSGRGGTLDSLAKQGVQFAVCSVATRALAGLIARAVSGDADAINTELIANLVSNARMVPAGIVAVNRAQERAYSLVTTF